MRRILKEIYFYVHSYQKEIFFFPSFASLKNFVDKVTSLI